MTLPFRGRHHDGEATHDRARDLTAEELFAPLGEEDAAWLARHVEACGECRTEREAWQADRLELRTLRDRPMEPPRDLWARTSAAIDREARGARRRRAVGESGRAAGRDVWRGLPLGAAAGALVVLIVVGASVIPNSPRPNETPGGSFPVAVESPVPQPTNLALTAADVGWIRQAADGTWELVVSGVGEVCPRAKAGCEALGVEALARPLSIGDDDTGVAISPDDNQLVVASRGDASEPGKVYVVPVPSAGGGPTPEPTPTSTPTVVVTAPPTGPAGSPTVTPTSTPSATPAPTPGTTPPGAIEIASGVIMVGEPAYNADGTWLAFSARPTDDSTGPDLYLWRVGDAEAVKVTDDHQTYFSAWHGGRVLASRVVVPAPVGPDASAEPTEAPATTEPSGTPPPGFNTASSGIPTSFLLDPATGVRTELGQPQVWLPVVDPAGRFAVYWSGQLVPTADGLGWQLGEGRLVLDAWLDPVEVPIESGEPSAAPSAGPSTEPSQSLAPGASPDPSSAPIGGPTGNAVEIEVGAIAAFQAKFDPEGVRIAVWVADEADASVGRLHLVVLDATTGSVDASVRPLPGAPALRRFSIDTGRLAWVSPRGQNGQESAVQVLGWAGREFGEIQTIPAKDLFIVR